MSLKALIIRSLSAAVSYCRRSLLFILICSIFSMRSCAMLIRSYYCYWAKMCGSASIKPWSPIPRPPPIIPSIPTWLTAACYYIRLRRPSAAATMSLSAAINLRRLIMQQQIAKMSTSVLKESPNPRPIWEKPGDGEILAMLPQRNKSLLVSYWFNIE
jgi:hypothetical protein